MKRETLVEALMHFKIHPKIITAITNIYTNDKTMVRMGELEKEINIQSGIRQGCTGSTVLFKFVTYLIMDEFFMTTDHHL